MKRVLPIIVLFIGACMLAYSIYMVGIGKSLVEPAGIVFTVIGLLILSLGVFFNVRLSRPKKQTFKPACMLMGHKWEKDYRNMNDPLWGKMHNCSRCGITQEHSWERIENRCQERCTKCGLQQSVTHNFVEKSPCHFICEICGEQEERHDFIKKTDCEKVCSKCGKVEVTHKWNTVSKDFPSETFWSMAQIRIFADNLPQNSMRCTCERCGETNPTGVHVCSGAWEGDFFVTKCKCCGTICKKETSEEIEARRYEQAVNEDEGIFS